MSLAGIRFRQITSWLHSSDPLAHMASDASSCRQAHRNMHAHIVWEKTLSKTDNRPDLTQYLIPIHSFTPPNSCEKAGRLSAGHCSFHLQMGGYGFQIEHCILIQMKHMLHLSELIGKAHLLSAWLIGILVSVSLRVQMNPDELFLVDKRSNIRVSPSVAARCFLLVLDWFESWTLQEVSRRVLYEFSSPIPEKKRWQVCLHV